MIGKTKITFLVMLVAMMALPFSMTEPAEARGTPEQEAELDRLLDQLFDLYDEKEEPKENSRSKRSLGEQNQLDREIDLLWSKYEALDAKIPKPELAEIEPEIRAKMELAEESIWDSEHFAVLLGWGINEEQGVLYIQVDKDQSGNITEELQAFVGADIPLKVVYQEDVSQHQSRYCDNSEKKCTPIIGGSIGEDRYWGKDCTVSIPAQKQVGRDIINGIVIPKHCVPTAKDGQEQTFFQSDNNKASHLVGSVHTNPLSSRCDCVFIESSSRNTDDSKIYRENRTDLSTSGKVELGKNDRVFVFGSTTGIKRADVTEINEKKRINGFTYSNLVEISHLGFTDGDSGAPVLKLGNGFPYGSMNIGQAYDDFGNLKNYAHSWSFIKSQLGLR